MALIVYNDGPDVRGVCGHVFKRGVPEEVTGASLDKCLRVGFVAVFAPAPMPAEDTDARQIEALGSVAETDVVEAPEIAPRKRGRPRKSS